MRNALQYIVDKNGIKISVIVPFDRWEKINVDYKKLRNKLEVFSAVQDGLVELKTAKKEGKELQMLSDFENNE
jgi:hypothetical protein